MKPLILIMSDKHVDCEVYTKNSTTARFRELFHGGKIP